MGVLSLDTSVFYSRLTLKFDTVVSVDLGVITTKDDSARNTDGCLITGYLSLFGRLTLKFISIVSVHLGVMTTKWTQQELQNGCLITGYLNFFGRLTLQFDSMVSVNLGVVETMDDSASVTEWVPSHWIQKFFRSSSS